MKRFFAGFATAWAIFILVGAGYELGRFGEREERERYLGKKLSPEMKDATNA